MESRLGSFLLKKFTSKTDLPLEAEFLTALPSSEAREFVRFLTDHQGVVFGGCLRSVFSGGRIADIDVHIPSTAFTETLAKAEELGLVHEDLSSIRGIKRVLQTSFGQPSKEQSEKYIPPICTFDIVFVNPRLSLFNRDNFLSLDLDVNGLQYYGKGRFSVRGCLVSVTQMVTRIRNKQAQVLCTREIFRYVNGDYLVKKIVTLQNNGWKITGLEPLLEIKSTVCVYTPCYYYEILELLLEPNMSFAMSQTPDGLTLFGFRMTIKKMLAQVKIFHENPEKIGYSSVEGKLIPY